MSGAKSWDLKLRTYALWTPHRKHTESAICKDQLAPCRSKSWTNQISIGISQPLAQLQRCYNVEIPRVSLPDSGAKWDFRTDSACKSASRPWHLESCTPGHGTRQYKMVCTQAGTSQYVPYSIQGRTRNLKMVHTRTYRHRSFLWQYILVCFGMYCLVPAQYKVVQGGTRWYKMVQDGTNNGIWRYMKVQGRTTIV